MRPAPTPDLDAFERALDALRAEVDARLGPADTAHLARIEALGRACAVLGLAACWFGVNVFAVVLLSLGTFVRWAIVAHHVTHGGYDKVPNTPPRYRSKVFGRSGRRFIDWLDWMAPEAWRQEHNVAHHYRLGELADPDQPEENLEWLRRSRLPLVVRRAIVLLLSVLWKPVYYAPNTWNALENHRSRHDAAALTLTQLFFAPEGRGRLREVVRRCWIPYPLWRFGVLPLPFLLVSADLYGAALINLLLAELLTNAHAFWVIVPNHAGDDLLRFDGPATTRAERLYRQIVGSTNYGCGRDSVDVWHGWLGYQIEHHVWPDLTLLQYRWIQPRLQSLCREHGIPYVQESVWLRMKKTMDVLTGVATMPRNTLPGEVSGSGVVPQA